MNLDQQKEAWLKEFEKNGFHLVERHLHAAHYSGKKLDFAEDWVTRQREKGDERRHRHVLWPSYIAAGTGVAVLSLMIYQLFCR